MLPSAHLDQFTRSNLPSAELLPDQRSATHVLGAATRINCAGELVDKWISTDRGDHTAVVGQTTRWTYRQLQAKANQIAHVLQQDLGLIPGNRVLLRAPNTPMLAACWLGVVKAGGVVVATMPLLRAQDLEPIVRKAKVLIALCDHRLAQDVQILQRNIGYPGKCIEFGDGQDVDGHDRLEGKMRSKAEYFDNVPTSADDVALIAFTSGTTGDPKGTMHFHRDVMAMCVSVGAGLVKAQPEDIFIGSPPIGFTFGLGMQLAIPLHAGATTVLLENPSPTNLASAISTYRATVCATAPTAYRKMLELGAERDVRSLRAAVSAGEHLPWTTYDHWKQATGMSLINGLGATEMLHIFVGASGSAVRPGAIGRALPGYEVRVVGDDGEPLPANCIGLLAVKGPTGCKYLADPRQKQYVNNGWNITGDKCSIDEDGYVWYHGRDDDMIVSAGYNISPHEVEGVLMTHMSVAECAVVGVPDEERGFIVKAFIVVKEGYAAERTLVQALQDHVKARIAPYKYPRSIEFVDALPKTQTGKVQRSRLRVNQ